MDTHRIAADGISVTFEPACGFATDLRVQDEGLTAAPLHRAPWIGEAVEGDRHLGRLQGDFFCAPFCGRDGPSGFHGWPANGDWRVEHEGQGLLRATLTHSVQGATLLKELSVEAGHPFLYQRHIFIGGQGRLPVANHAMVTLPEGGKISLSRKRWFETTAAPLVTDPLQGRSRLVCPQRVEDGTELAAQDGGTVNLFRYPWGERHEDFVSCVEDPASVLGWTAVVRLGKRDLFLSLKNARALPQTGLWHSNGGREAPPWNGRHRFCLGVEEGAALHMLGLSSKENPNPLTAAGQPGDLALDPQGTVEVRHVIGAIAWPTGQAVAGVSLDGDVLTVTGDWGAERKLPIRGGWLQLAPPAAPAARPKVWDDL
jgi:hypothetical protein